jgi:hypothetical protein
MTAPATLPGIAYLRDLVRPESAQARPGPVRVAPAPRPTGRPSRRLDAEQVSGWLLAVPITLANIIAALGQSIAGQPEFDKVAPWAISWGLAVLLAVTLETFSLVFTRIAHTARLNRDAALPPQLAAYLIAGVVALSNWWHWSDDWAPTYMAWAFAGFSFASPWVWAAWSKARHRVELRAAGLIDGRTVRFSLARWCMAPIRTFFALRVAVLEGIATPQEAAARYEQIRAERRARRAARRTARRTAKARPAAGQATTVGPLARPTGQKTGSWSKPPVIRGAVGGTGAAPATPPPAQRKPAAVPPAPHHVKAAQAQQERTEEPTAPERPALPPAGPQKPAEGLPDSKVTVEDIVTRALVANPAAGFPTISARVRAAGHSIGDSRLKQIIRAAKGEGGATP